MTDVELHELYDRDWSPFAQSERDEATIQMGKTFESVEALADLSAGGSRIPREVAEHYGVTPVLGDFSHVYGYRFVGPLSQTLHQFGSTDLFICTETIEHLNDPDSDLGLIRQRCNKLLLSTPVMEKPPVVSHGHLWTWEREDVEAMLASAGFQVISFLPISIFGIWTCR